MGWRGLLAGALGLAALERVVANPGAYGRVGSLLSGLGAGVRHFMDPAVPAFSKAAPSASSGGGGLGLSLPVAPGIAIPISARPSSPYAGLAVQTA